MTAGVYDIVIDQGSDYFLDVIVKNSDGTPLDLSQYSARAQIRETKESEQLTASFTCTVVEPTSQGKIQMFLPNAVSTPILAGSYFYDLEIFTANDALVKRIVGGRVRITQEVTR